MTRKVSRVGAAAKAVNPPVASLLITFISQTKCRYLERSRFKKQCIVLHDPKWYERSVIETRYHPILPQATLPPRWSAIYDTASLVRDEWSIVCISPTDMVLLSSLQIGSQLLQGSLPASTDRSEDTSNLGIIMKSMTVYIYDSYMSQCYIESSATSVSLIS